MTTLSLFDENPPSQPSPVTLPGDWNEVLHDEIRKSYFAKLLQFVQQERAQHQVFPPEPEVFSAFALTPYREVKVLLLGQDPYHDHNQAHGLCFSVRPGIKPPPSLVNIFKELRNDVGCTIPKDGFLESWAKQGVLLLNTVLTVRAHEANSHKGQGWEQFTDAVIQKVNQKTEPVVFLLWGNPAQKKEKLIDRSRHFIIKGVHPSPLSASNGFFGSKPFSAVNSVLKQHGHAEINWCLPV